MLKVEKKNKKLWHQWFCTSLAEAAPPGVERSSPVLMAVFSVFSGWLVLAQGQLTVRLMASLHRAVRARRREMIARESNSPISLYFLFFIGKRRRPEMLMT